MKARTHYWNEGNHCEIFFCYEDYYGNRYRSYDELKADGDGSLYLMGYLKSHYWNCSEPIDELRLDSRPTFSRVKAFIKKCKDFIFEDKRNQL